MRSSRGIRGFGSVWVVMIGMAFVGLLGLAVDMAYVSLCTEQAQNTADAAALAGAWGLRRSQNAGGSQTAQTQSAFTAAQNTALANYIARQSVTITNADIVPGHFYRPGDSKTYLGFVSDPAKGGLPYNAVQATAERTAAANGPVALMFGRIFGVPGQSLTSSAVAIIGGRPPGIIVLDPGGSAALDLTGSVYIASQNGSIAVNSSSSTGFKATGSVQIVASEIDVVGSYKATGSVTLPPVKTGQTAVVDPLAGLPAPAATGPAGVLTGTVFQPGYYANGISVTGSSNYTFQSGIYVIDKGISAAGSTVLSGSNVTLIIRTGSISMTGSSSLSLSAPTSGPYAGVTIFQLPTDSSAASLTGTSATLTGTLYFPAASLSYTGTSASFSNQIIAYQLHLSGTASLTVPAGLRFGYTGGIALVQ